jgi:hypothetical protein
MTQDTDLLSLKARKDRELGGLKSGNLFGWDWRIENSTKVARTAHMGMRDISR